MSDICSQLGCTDSIDLCKCKSCDLHFHLGNCYWLHTQYNQPKCIKSEQCFVCGFCLEKKPEKLGKHHADTWHCHKCLAKNLKECPDKGERMFFSKDRKIPILKRNGKKHKFRMNYRRNSKNKICLDDIGKYGKDWIISLPVKKG